MKKWIALLLSLAMILTCAAALAEEAAAEPRVAHYQIRNATGAGLFKLFVTDNVTGEVFELISEGEAFPAGEIIFFDLAAPEGATDEELVHRYTLSFSDGREEMTEFKTLSFENVLIDLLAEDAMTGATPIRFDPKMVQVGSYKIINKTEKKLSTVTFTENANPNNNLSHGVSLEPGENETVRFFIDPAAEGSHALTVEFTFADGTSCSFSTLSIEEASLTLTTDTVTGATPFSFGRIDAE